MKQVSGRGKGQRLGPWEGYYSRAVPCQRLDRPNTPFGPVGPFRIQNLEQYRSQLTVTEPYGSECDYVTVS